ncbi:unnamed protein product [Brachionus calyciflorus]|uniref:Glutaredoxin 3 n=1 Tax=Brachionus calyciflorus TaxID=104777 RepID=A0A813LXR4_9BILA|nr:unnamed protein product [Brachionus calyciflorus]
MSVLNKLDKLENFQKFLEENANALVVLFFAANWSDESKLMNNVLQELSKDERNKNVLRVLEVEAEDFEEISIKYGIEAVPTFVLIKNKQVVSKLSGADPAELRKRISQGLQTSTSSTAQKPEDLNDRLKRLVNQAPVVLFMKGTPQEPRCGFSRTTIEILKNNNVTFSYFDILSDNEVREGLKKYSNWPTYPQLYIKGDLIGGLDILKELVASGEFQSMIPSKDDSLNEKLRKIINTSKVMLFMKGRKDEPKCGFSRQIIEILNETGAKYESFDILTDDEVRQGLKEYSNWPTFPQLYVDGELVGGLDIVKELKQSGELETTLKGNQ